MRVGNEPALETSSNGTSYLRLSMVYNYGRKGSDGKYESQWVSGTLFGRQAEGLAPYIEKGSSVEVSLKDLHNEEHNGKTYMKGEIVSFGFVSGGKRAETQNKPVDNQEDSDDIPF